MALALKPQTGEAKCQTEGATLWSSERSEVHTLGPRVSDIRTLVRSLSVRAQGKCDASGFMDQQTRS